MNIIMRKGLSVLLAALVIGVTVVGCANDLSITAQSSAVKEAAGSKAQPLRGMSVIFGRVTMGPMSPVEGIEGSRGPAPFSGARIVISGLDGKEIRSAVTDTEGRYNINLPPGTYRVEMAPVGHGRFTKDLPATVTITEGQEARLDILVDTGIR
jgi:hypothetical protein